LRKSRWFIPDLESIPEESSQYSDDFDIDFAKTIVKDVFKHQLKDFVESELSNTIKMVKNQQSLRGKLRDLKE